MGDPPGSDGGRPLTDLRALAVRAALEGGRVIRVTEVSEVRLKGRAADYVTEVDRLAEEAIREILEPSGIPVVGEEMGGTEAGRHWLVDPVDGTVNLMHGFPAVGVSVCLVEDGRPAAGAVHAPFLGTTWSASRGGGADRDGQPIRVSDRPPERAVVGTGFPFRYPERLAEYRVLFDPALERFEDLRRPGAVALDLAWTAEGTFDGFFELALSPWDVAAGALLIEEAGGLVTDWTGGPRYLSGDILAGPPPVHRVLLELARTAPR